MHALIVGKPYHPARSVWDERADFNYRAGGHELVLFVGQARRSEVEAVKAGPVEFGLLVDQPLLFLVVRFLDSAGKSVMSFDCSYSWHRVPPEDRTMPPSWEETKPALRALCPIILVEATTGIVLALRTVTFSPVFTRALHRVIADQAALPYDAAEHDQAVDAMLRFTTDQLWAKSTTRCRGGD